MLSGKIALVTGAARGIGKGCALELARAGATLVLADTNEAALVSTAEEIAEIGGHSVRKVSNVFKRTECENLVERTLEAFEAIDILVSNPSWNRAGNFLDYSPDVFIATVHCTLMAGFYISQPVARHMVERGKGGNIIFISSIQSVMPSSRSPAYNAAKRGLEAFAETIAADLARDNVRVNTIRPGWTDTPLERRKYGGDLETEGAKIPLGRVALPEDIGKAVVAVCTLPYLTGQHISVDGALSLAHLQEPRRDADVRDNIDSPIPDYD